MDTTTCFFFALILVNVLRVIHMVGKPLGKKLLENRDIDRRIILKRN